MSCKRQKVDGPANIAKPPKPEPGTVAAEWMEMRHTLYEQATQEGGDWMEKFARNFQQLRQREARSMREDFCGTFAHCCTWARQNALNIAVGVDNDAKVLKWGLEEFGSQYSGLEEEEQQRITVSAGSPAHCSPFPDIECSGPHRSLNRTC